MVHSTTSSQRRAEILLLKELSCFRGERVGVGGMAFAPKFGSQGHQPGRMLRHIGCLGIRRRFGALRDGRFGPRGSEVALDLGKGVREINRLRYEVVGPKIKRQ